MTPSTADRGRRVRPRRASADRVTPGVSLLLLAAALAGAALVATGLGGLVPQGDVAGQGPRSAEGAAAPAAPAPVPALADVAPLAPFDAVSATLPAASTGPFREAGGSWRVDDGGAAAIPAARAPATPAVVEPPPDARTVQVAVPRPRPGAGVVAAWSGPDRYVALVVDPSGRNLTLLRVLDQDRPDVLLRVPLSAPGESLVLALRREGGRFEAIANGAVLGSRVVTGVGDGTAVGLVAGPGRSGEASRFRDLVVG